MKQTSALTSHLTIWVSDQQLLSAFLSVNDVYFTQHCMHCCRLITVATPQQQRLHLQQQKQNGATHRAPVIAHAAPVSKSSSSSSGDLAAGLLFVFEKNERCVLALVVRPDGKKNWMVLDEVSIAAFTILQGNHGL